MSYNSNTYTYTSNGELATLEEGLFSKFKYTHDALGRLKEVLTPKGDRLSYILDWNGRRVAIAENGKQIATRIYEDQYRIAAEYNRKRTVIQEYVYSTSINSPDYMTERNARYKFIKDHLGSPRLIVHSVTGKIVQRLDYSEFGKVIIDTNQGLQPFGFAGGIKDPNTGLLKFGARNYDPEVGRWTSKDPILFAGGDTNLYGYVQNDPVNWIDPTGLLRDPRDIFDEALNHPNSSSGTNGPGNAFQHCFASCMMAAENGSATAAALGAGFEFINNLQGQKGDAYCMDTHNNQAGRDLAKENGISNLTGLSDASHRGVSSSCAKACNGANASGRLVNLGGN